MSAADKSFVFIHIPKTGGVTFHNIITNQFRFKKQYLWKLKELNKWDLLSAKEKTKYTVVKGHIPFLGVDFYPGKCTYFTFLRDPEKRIISHYLHIKSTPSHKLYKKLQEDNYSLTQFLKNGEALLFDNCMVRFISGNYQKPWGDINESDLQLAIHNFDTCFEHFGLVEEYDKSLVILAHELGWKTPFYIPLNERKVKDKPGIDKETAELISRFSKYDKLLWEHAKTKFNIKVEKYGSMLVNDVEAFRKRNSKNLFFRNMYYQLKDKLFRQPI